MYNVQDYSILYKNAVRQLHARDGILLTCGKHLTASFSLRRKVWAHKTGLTWPLFIEELYQARKVR